MELFPKESQTYPLGITVGGWHLLFNFIPQRKFKKLYWWGKPVNPLKRLTEVEDY